MNDYGKVRSMLDTLYPQLTKSEKKIADHVLSQYDKVVNYSLTELAQNCEVGESTVLRFCKKLGYKGYPEFRVAFAQNVAYFDIEVSRENEETDFAKVIKNNIVSRLTDCYSNVDFDELNKAIDLILSSKRVISIGAGGSGISAMTFREKFTRIGMLTDAIIDSHMQGIISSILGKDDLMIAFSISGNTKDIITALKIAKERGVKTVLITSYTKSTASKYADVILRTSTKKEFLRGGMFVATVTQMYMVELLVTGTALRDFDTSKKYNEGTNITLRDKQYDSSKFDDYWRRL